MDFIETLKLVDNQFQDGRELRRLFGLKQVADLPASELAAPAATTETPADPAAEHSMRLETRREIGKLREVTRHYLIGQRCFFCKDFLVAPAVLEDSIPGERGRPFPEVLDVTEHHIDGDHDNNMPSNRTLCHDSCHRSYHRKLENKKGKRKKTTGPAVVEADEVPKA